MISAEKWKNLEARLSQAGIYAKDIQEHFIRSGGHGGQNVNKVSTCVYLKHLPSGIEVKCQKTRSQIDNRYFARVILAEKIENEKLGAESKKAQEIFKIRKQKQKRTKRTKERLLEMKKMRSERKNSRRTPDFE